MSGIIEIPVKLRLINYGPCLKNLKRQSFEEYAFLAILVITLLQFIVNYN